MFSDYQKNIDTPIHFENNSLRIKYNQQRSFVEFTFKTFIKDEALKSALLRLVEMTKHTLTKKLLFNAKNFSGASAQTNRWLNEVWAVEAHKIGVENIAVVMPNSAFGVFSLKQCFGTNFLNAFKMFKSDKIFDAESWLLNQ